MPVNFRIRAAPHLDHCRIKDSRVIAAYKRHTSQHMVLKEDIKKKNYTSFKSVVDVLVVFPLLQDVEILCAV